MKLTWWNYSGINAYTIEEESKKFKSIFPKKYIVVSIEMGSIDNIDDMDDLKYNPEFVSYMFMYGKPIYGKELNSIYKASLTNTENSKIYKLAAFPVDLSNYFISSNSESKEIMIKLSPNQEVVDPRLYQNIIFKVNSLDLQKNPRVKSIINEKMNKIYETRINKLTSCEDWLTDFLLSKDISKDLNGEPLRFPKLINNNSFKKPLKFNFDNWTVGYASRNSLKSELDTTKIIENMFVKFNKNIKIKNNYNNIANKILKKAEKSKINVKPVYDNEKNIVSVKISTDDFYKLKLKFAITDFLN